MPLVATGPACCAGAIGVACPCADPANRLASDSAPSDAPSLRKGMVEQVIIFSQDMAGDLMGPGLVDVRPARGRSPVTGQICA